jgi:hypothetical protein
MLLLPQLPIPGCPAPALCRPGVGALALNDPAWIIFVQDGFWPAMFVWRGRRITVQAVTGYEARKRHTFCGPVTDHHFAVVTDAGRFRLCHAPHAARWSVTSIGGAQ